MVGVLGVRSRVVRGGCVWCWSCVGCCQWVVGVFWVVYGSEWGLVLVVVVFIGARIDFLCIFEG